MRDEKDDDLSEAHLISKDRPKVHAQQMHAGVPTGVAARRERAGSLRLFSAARRCSLCTEHVVEQTHCG